MLSIEKKIKIYSLFFFISLISCNPSGSTFSPNPDPIIPAQSVLAMECSFTLEIILILKFFIMFLKIITHPRKLCLYYMVDRDVESARNNMTSKSIEYNFIVIAQNFHLMIFLLVMDIIWVMYMMTVITLALKL